MRFSDAQTCKIVELYRDNECLWNPNNPFYKSKQVKQAACEAIAREMDIEGFNPSDVRGKLKNLRGTYNLESQRIVKSALAGDYPVYVPNIKWYTIMDSFIRGLKNGDKSLPDSAEISTTQTLDLVDSQQSGQDSGISAATTQQRSVANPEIIRVTPEIQSVPSIATTGLQQSFAPEAQQGVKFVTNPEVMTVTPDIQHQNVKYVSGGNFFQVLPEVQPRVEDIPTPRKRPHTEFNSVGEVSDAEDEMDAFGRFVALNLRKMSMQTAMSAQAEILSVLTRHRLNDCKSSVVPPKQAFPCLFIRRT